MPKTILITGAGSGFGESAAIGMAKNGHTVIATVQVSPQVTPLREKAKAMGLINLRVERLDLTDPYDMAQARKRSTSTCCGTTQAWARRDPYSKSPSISCATITK